MKIKMVALLMFVAIPHMACQKPEEPGDFEMRVEKVEELKGMILKGIAISGTVRSGCIANEDQYIVKRDGANVLETMARILGGAQQEGGPVFKGDRAALYIPDVSMDAVRVGDVAVSGTISCRRASR